MGAMTAAGLPGELTASRVATWPDGTIAEVALNESAAAYARWHRGGGWGGWVLVADGVRDISVCAEGGREERSALVGVVRLAPLPYGGIAALHVFWSSAIFRLTASGVVPLDL